MGENCKFCELSIEREVPYEGKAGASIVFVGSSPTRSDIRKGKPFSGDEGTFLRTSIKEHKFSSKEVAFVNAARCLIDKSSMTEKEIAHVLKLCRPSLEKILLAIKPKIIVCLGGIALKQILDLKGVDSLKGKFLPSEEFNCSVFVMNSPKVILKTPAKQPMWEKHMDALEIAKVFGVENVKEEEVEYRAVNSIRNLILKKKNITVSLDTETEGNDVNDSNSIVICYSVTDEEKKGYVVWLHGEVPIDKADFTIKVNRLRVPEGKKKAIREEITVGVKRFPEYDRRLAELRELLARKDIKKAMAYGVYDLLRADQLLGEFELNSFTLSIEVIAHLLDENTFIQPSLEQLQNEFTDMSINQKEEIRDEDKSDLLKMNPHKLTPYSGADVDGTLRVANVVRKKLLEDKRATQYYVKLLQPAVEHFLYPLTKNGIYIDSERLPTEEKEIMRNLKKHEKTCISMFSAKLREKWMDKGLSLTKRDMIRDYLYDPVMGLGITSISETKKGLKSADQNTLKILKETPTTPEEALRFIDAYSKYSEYYTLESRYINGLKKAMHENSRIYPSYAIKTNTGRLAAFDPNSMNFPKRSDSAKHIRRLLAAPPGWVLLAFDFRQQELRWVAHASQDPTMLKVFKTGGDIHITTAEAIMGCSLSKLSSKKAKEARRNAKPVNFGFIYGMFPPGFQRFALTDYGIKFTLEQSEQYREDYFALYDGLPPWHERAIGIAQEKGKIYSVYGRPRHLTQIHSRDFMTRSYAERQAINAPIQSAGSDSGLLAGSIINRNGLLDISKAYLTMFIHDELIFCVKENYAQKAKNVIVQVMENLPFEDFGINMTVPLEADCNIGHNLSEMTEF